MKNILNSNVEKFNIEYGLDKNDLDVFSGNLATSFKGYELFEELSDYKYNVKKMKRFWKVSLKTIAKKAVFLTDGEAANSLAIFLPYQKKGVSTWEYVKAGALLFYPTMGIKTTNRMTSFENFALEIKKKHSKPGCWYLYTFVTMPGFRGKGLCSKIMRPMLNYFDDHNQDCYLETVSPVNVEIYKKFGFELVEEVEVPNTNLTLYAMLRKPKTNEK